MSGVVNDASYVPDASGWCLAARRCLSPNRDARPAGTPVELIVVHGISLPPGEFGGPWIDALFTNTLPAGADAHPYFRGIAGLKVSAHFLIRRDGELVQYVPTGERAWHAGASSWRGRARCNDYSIGIELEGTDATPYADAQYATLAVLLPALRRAHPQIAVDALAGHCDIAPGRKTDPGPAFDWSRLHALLGATP